MSEWQERSLAEVLSVAHGYAFKGKDFGQGGSQRLVTPGNFYERGGFRDRGQSQKSYEGPVPSEFVLPAGSLVIAMTEQAPGLLGSAGLIPNDRNTWLHNQRIGLVRVRDGAADERFLYYLFNDPSVRSQIEATSTGTKVRHTAPGRIQAVQVRMPDVHAQRRIAAVLSAFDGLIEINERRIDLLENLARSLYREWFVHFRFPGHEDVEFVDSELGRIPDGWEVRSSEAVLSPLGGGTPSKKRADYWNGGLIPWFTPSDLTRSRDRYVADSQSQITTLGLKESGARIFPSGSVLMTSRATLGVLAIATKESTCNQGFIVIPPVEGIPSEFIYEWLANHETQLAALATGATFKEITKAAFKRFPFLLPKRPVIAMFAEAVGPVGEQISGYERGNRSLAATRDLLLPRLVTGRLDISDVDLGDLLPADAA